MLRNFDEKLNGFLSVTMLSIMLFAICYCGFEFSYTRFEVGNVIFQKFSFLSMLYLALILKGIIVARHFKNFIIRP